MLVAVVITPVPTEIVIARFGGTMIAPVNVKLNTPAASSMVINSVGDPVTFPVATRAVAILAVTLPNWLLKGVGVVPPVTVPVE